MHPSLDHDESPDAETVALRQRIRFTLARDLNLPVAHAAGPATAPHPADHATPDTCWRIVAHTHALSAR